MRSTPLGGDRGAAAVEFALVVPLLLALVLGTIDWGYYFFVEQVVVNAAREGARVGTLQSNATPADAQTNAQAACVAFITQAGLDPSRATCTPSTGVDSIVVTASYTTGSLTGFADAIVPAQAYARAEMRN